MGMFDDFPEDIETSGLKKLIGKKVVSVELRNYTSFKGRLGNITLVFDDGTCVQGTDGEYGTNNMVIMSEGK